MIKAVNNAHKYHQLNEQTPVAAIRDKWANRTKAALVIRKLVYTVLAALLKPSNKKLSHYFKARARRVDTKINTLVMRTVFGEAYKAKAFNILQKPLMKGAQSHPAAVKLKKEVDKVVNEHPAIKMAPLDEKSLQHLVLSGLCLGINVDLAEKYLIQGQNLEQISEVAAIGGTLEAEANEAVFGALVALRLDDPIPVLFETFKALSEAKSEDGLFDVDFDHVKEVFHQILEEDPLPDQASYIAGFDPPLTPKQIELVNWAFALVEFKGLYTLFRDHLRDPNAPDNIVPYTFTPSFTMMGQQLSDPVLNDIILGFTVLHCFNRPNLDVLAKARGLQIVDVHSKMGFPARAANYSKYLTKLHKLDPGFYGVLLNEKNSHQAHIISYIKNVDGSGLLIEPNGAQIHSDTPEMAASQIMKLLDRFYSSIAEVAASPRDRMQILKYEKA